MTEKIQVTIHLHTKINDNGETETVEEQHEGICMQKGETTVLLYTDNKNESGEVKNIITIHPERLSVKRSGAISMQQIFLVGQKTECMYQHPYGRFLLEIKTTTLETSSNQVVVAYDMLFEGTNRHYKLTIDYTEVH